MKDTRREAWLRHLITRFAGASPNKKAPPLTAQSAVRTRVKGEALAGSKGSALGRRRLVIYLSSFILSTARNASLGTSTVPNWRMRFLPSFCFSSSFFLRVMSPP